MLPLAIVLVVVVSLVLWLQIRADENVDPVTAVIVIVIGLAVCAAFVTVRARDDLQAGRALRARLRAAHPHARVLLCLQTERTVRDARHAGAPTRGIRRRSGRPMAVVRDGDVVDVWFPRDSAPRWRVRWSDDRVRVVDGAIARGIRVPVLEIGDDDTAVHLLPLFLKEDLTSPSHKFAVAEGLRVLGADPARYVTLPPGRGT